MAKIPIGNSELGVIYESDKKSAFFYTLDSAYYNNIMIKTQPNAVVCTYEDFKKLYPNHIHSNFHQKNH